MINTINIDFLRDDYLAEVFAGNITDRFSSSNGHYELFYPVKIEGKIIVLYLSERQRYGKIGS